MIFKFLLLLLIAQVIYCQEPYPYERPVSNNGNGCAQNYGNVKCLIALNDDLMYFNSVNIQELSTKIKQCINQFNLIINRANSYLNRQNRQQLPVNNGLMENDFKKRDAVKYDTLQNGYFKYPFFDSSKMECGKETPNSSTLNGRKRCTQFKKRDAVNNGLNENDFKGNVKCLITLNDDLMNSNNVNNQELSTKIKRCIYQFNLIINKANSILNPQNQPTNKSTNVNFNLQRNEQVQTKQPFQQQAQQNRESTPKTFVFETAVIIGK